MRRFQIPAVIPVLLLLLLSPPCQAMKGISADGTLDKTTLSKAYFEGEFWTVITALEEYRKKGIASATRDDSVYTYKYLSVVYAADPSTRQKAESYMYLLLRMMPTIDLLDLYISDNIESIFQKVRSDFARMQKIKEANVQVTKSDSIVSAVDAQPTAAATPADSIGPTPPPASVVSPQDRRSPFGPWVWVALGGGVAASVVTYFILADAGGGKAENPTQTWEPQFNPPQQ